MYVVDTHIYVVKHMCRISHICCKTKYVFGNDVLFNLLFNRIYCLKHMSVKKIHVSDRS